ncbi:PWI domain-containing protein [Gonapodya prolifera JEL478]|uniref:PWI domain-containing protein n=1 Tax=Gonapodya prolifera (strain JEL478) TaxID=1344416 RepID=A0A139ATY0_GONPJ|nr:PWI domain-containing protein [Gonapodya prolifera JEL478]|eukprot:KXS20168.1 PWI domain-containing protein [Gonapodya prolifera JEL478]
MGDGGYFKGTSADQDTRFGDKQKKLLKSMNFPSIFNTKVQMKNVQVNALKPWITKRIIEILGFEDDVVITFIFEYLAEPIPDPKMMQINLTGFLESNTAKFMEELWGLLVSAQEKDNMGIPRAFLEQKKAEIAAKQEADARLKEALKRQREKEEANIRDAQEARERERRERATREVQKEPRNSREEPNRRRRTPSRSRSRSRSPDESRPRRRRRDSPDHRETTRRTKHSGERREHEREERERPRRNETNHSRDSDRNNTRGNDDYRRGDRRKRSLSRSSNSSSGSDQQRSRKRPTQDVKSE